MRDGLNIRSSCKCDLRTFFRTRHCDRDSALGLHDAVYTLAGSAAAAVSAVGPAVHLDCVGWGGEGMPG